MRFIAYEQDGKAGLAAQTAEGWMGMTEDAPHWPGDLDTLIRSGGFEAAAASLSERGQSVDPETLTHALPFKRADKVLCVGLNYADHAAESKMDLPTFPTVFVRFNSNLVPHGAPLVKPTASDDFDYEAELVAVIGKEGRAIPKDRALEHVAGYSLFNDGSIRDYQLRTNQWTIGKNFDATGALGPVFVTADELPEGARGLRITTTLSGEVLQDANTDQLIFDVADLVSKISEAMTLRPGDLIVTGTPSGVGMARSPKRFMKDGDTCVVEVEKVGKLSNPIVNES